MALEPKTFAVPVVILGQTNYGTVYLDSAGEIQTVSPGTSGNVLTSNGSSAAPTFQAASGGPSGVITGIGYSVPTGATKYVLPWAVANSSPKGYDASIEFLVEMPVPFTGHIKDLQAVMNGAPGSGNSIQFTLFINGSSTALTCTISGASATTAVDATHSVAVSAGDLVTLQLVTSAALANNQASWSFVIQ